MVYGLSKSVHEKQYYKCKFHDCGGSMHANNGACVCLKMHTCVVPVGYIESLRVLSLYDHRALNENVGVVELVNNLFGYVTNDVAVCLPSREALRMRFSRLKRKKYPPIPQNLKYMVIGR